MHVPITTITLALMTFLVFLVRVFWLRLPSIVRFFLIRAALVLIVIHVLFSVTNWTTTSDRLNVVLKWLAIGGYELLLMLFSSFSPKWLTSICAFILLVPVFSSTIVLPLTRIFDPTPYRLQPIGNNLYYQNLPWGVPDNSGTLLLIYYKPSFAPFLRRNMLDFPFNNQECNANAAFAILRPDGKHILARCPHWPSQMPGSDDRIFPIH